eukprot:2065786-Prymnesium_polylepis.1
MGERGKTLVDSLYRTHRPELLALEAEVASDTSHAGERMRRWLTVVRHCIMAWLVSCVARPRDRWGYIDVEQPQKRQLVAAVFRSHFDCLLDTPDFQQLEATVRAFEAAEVEMGDLAKHGGMERRMTGEIRAGFTSLPGQVAGQMQPQFDQQARALDDEVELSLDRDYLNSLPPEIRELKFPPLALGA